MLNTQKYLTNCKSLYICIYCRAHLANHDELVSRSFQGMNGRAYLFNSVINITCGAAVQRELITGSHAVADIYCANCKTVLGWKYEKAYEENQRYKEGKFIIELAHVIRENRHLELDRGELLFSTNRSGSDYKRMQQTRANFSNWQDCSGSLSSPTPSSPSTTSPASPSGWPILSSVSPDGNLLDDEDEELMSPFYEELCADRSSYPSSLTSSHHNRMRRSLYLDSTPYDWKFSARNEATSLIDPPHGLNVYAALNESEDVSNMSRKQSDLNPSSSCFSPRHNGNSSSGVDQSENYGETQFKFEADRIEQAVDSDDNKFGSDSGTEDNNKRDNGQVASGIFNEASTRPTGGSKQISMTNYTNADCDDEEFFDCNSDHDILNS